MKMKSKNRKKQMKENRQRERDLTVYLWMLKHACEKTSYTTPTQEWSAKL